MIILPFHLKKLASYHTVLGLQLLIIFIVDFSDRLIGDTMKFKISDAAKKKLHKHRIHRNFKIKAQILTLNLHALMSTYSSNYSGYNIYLLNKWPNIKD